MQCAAATSSRRKQSSASSSSLKRRIPVRRRNQVIIFMACIVGHMLAYTRWAPNPHNPLRVSKSHVFVNLQYTPTPPSAISASFFHGMSAIHLLVVLTEILIPRRRSFHLFGAAVSANDSDSELEWISTSNEQVNWVDRLSPFLHFLCADCGCRTTNFDYVTLWLLLLSLFRTLDCLNFLLEAMKIWVC